MGVTFSTCFGWYPHVSGIIFIRKKHISESVAQLTVIILATNLLFLVVANTLTMIYCSPLGSPLVFYVLLTSPFLHGNLFYFRLYRWCSSLLKQRFNWNFNSRDDSFTMVNLHQAMEENTFSS